MAVSSSVSTGVAQSGEWSVCMCRSTWTKSRSAEPLADLAGSRWRRAGARRSRRRAPRRGRPRATTRARGARRSIALGELGRRSAGSREQALELGGERERVARLEQQAELAVAQRLLVLRQARHHGHRAAGQRAQHELGRGRRARPRPPRRSGAREVLGLRPVAGPGERTRSRRRRGSVTAPAPRPGRAARSSRASRGRVGSRRSARRKSRSAPRSSSAEKTISGGPAVGRGRARRSAPGWITSVLAGEVALDQVAGRGKLAVRPSSRPNSSSTTRRATCVESSARWRVEACRRSARASGAAPPTPRWARTARARARSRARRGRAGPRACATRRAGAPPSRRAERQRSGRRPRATRSPGSGEERVGVSAQRLDGRPALADQLPRVRRRDHHHAVAAPRRARPRAAPRSG